LAFLTFNGGERTIIAFKKENFSLLIGECASRLVWVMRLTGKGEEGASGPVNVVDPLEKEKRADGGTARWSTGDEKKEKKKAKG